MAFLCPREGVQFSPGRAQRGRLPDRVQRGRLPGRV